MILQLVNHNFSNVVTVNDAEGTATAPRPFYLMMTAVCCCSQADVSVAVEGTQHAVFGRLRDAALHVLAHLGGALIEDGPLLAR